MTGWPRWPDPTDGSSGLQGVMTEVETETRLH